MDHAGEPVKESDHEFRAGHSSNTSSPSLQRSLEGVTSAAADHVVLARSDDVTDARANKHGQNHQAERVITISEESNVKKRVWILTAEMVQNSTLSSVDIDIMCHSKGQPGVGESNVPVQAMLGEDLIMIAFPMMIDDPIFWQPRLLLIWAWH